MPSTVISVASSKVSLIAPPPAFRAPSPATSQATPSILQSGYDMFITRVSEGRKIPPEEVEKSAQGRVFTGQEAFNRKLVDQLGDLDDAIASACDLAGLDSVQVKELRRKLSPREKFMQSLASSEQALFRHVSCLKEIRWSLPPHLR